MKKVLLSVLGLSAAFMSAQTWTTQNTNFPATSTGITKVQAVNSSLAWAFGYDGSGGGANLQVFTKTTNGGTTWTPGTFSIGLSSLLISDLTAVDASTAWVMAVNTSGGANDGIWKTTDGGTVWTKQTTATFSNAASFPNLVHFFDANNGVAQGDPLSGVFEIYTTSNGGTTWTRVPAANIPAAPNEFGYVHLAKVVGNTIWFGTDLGRIFRSNDRGLTWAVSQSPVIDFGGVTTAGKSGDFTMKDANTGWAIDQDGILYSTTDAANWEPVASSGTVYGGDICFVPGTANTLISTGISTTASMGYGSSISTDGGLTWTVIDDTVQYGATAAYDASTVYAGGFNGATSGGMFKLSPLMATVNPKLAANKVVAYPNPTKGQVNLESKSSIKSIELMDMSGKLVKTFGSITQLDLTGMKSGMYILNVTLADGQKTSTKLIKD